MLHFFSKKTYLADFLGGFIDIHNHILPGIDDGAKNVGESISLLKAFGELGVQKFVHTPHVMNTYYPNTPSSIQGALAILKEALHEEKMTTFENEASAEYMIDANFEDILAQDDALPIKEHYLLIEMSFLQASINFEEAIPQIAKQQLFPILAHPERYLYLHHRKGKYHEYKEKGILFQMNMLSLSRYYGKEVQKAAFKLIGDDLIDFFASDVHNIGQLDTLKEIQLSKKIAPKVEAIVEKTVANFT